MTTTNDAPAPAPSASGVRVDDMAMLIRLLVRNMPPGLKIRDAAVDYMRRHDLMGSPLREDASLASDASPRDEAVAWRWRYPGGGWRVAMVNPHEGRFAELEHHPLYAHPAPATVERALRAAKMLVDNINEFGQVTDAEILDCAEKAVREALGFDEEPAPFSVGASIAALAPATEGRKG
ncbi:hypothetical protein IED13_01135 [Bosea sp. SSUT16]|uniref:Uncharacterized protein n=1 Tax=Bosea spartocytisi TaxID=2773451 RepID=A0A927E4K5_9HYPH|nr:hypothetical protein [Bosea spartocytisi]MBD3844283.1 hypothetical protein [Bosea spartocytisi]MCT4470611.1 hypothetical protein [Bosea spartocytisi]